MPSDDELFGMAANNTTRCGGLTQRARQIECALFRLRVPGTARSGKTRLAPVLYREAIGAGFGNTVGRPYLTIAWDTRLFRLLR